MRKPATTLFKQLNGVKIPTAQQPQGAYMSPHCQCQCRR